jgi:hypothetical protein
MASEIKANKLSPATGTDVTLGDSGDTFTVPSGATITNSGTASGFGLFSSYAIIADQKAQNTGGGTFTLGAWRTRDLQTEIADPDGIVSIASDQFTLAAGSYLIRWSAPGQGVRLHQTQLYNVTDSSVEEVGQSMASRAGVLYSTTQSSGFARVVITGSKAFEIQHYCSYTHATIGMGEPLNVTTEEYTVVEIFKEA